MTAPRRWALVALVTAVLVAAPLAWRLVPAQESDLDAAELYALVDDAADRPYTGYVETEGTLAAAGCRPVPQRRRPVRREHPAARVVARPRPSGGSTQLHATGETALRARRRCHHGVRLRGGHLDHQLRPADPAAPHRRPAAARGGPPAARRRRPRRGRRGCRRAGWPASPPPGSASTGDDGRSSIGHVDLWADPDTGLPLRVEVYARGAATPGFTRCSSTTRPTSRPATRSTFRGTDEH